MTMGYGGLIVGCSMDPDRLVHITLDALMGGGSIRLDKENGSEVEGVSDTFFVIEPGATLDLNLTDFARLGVGISYRFVGGLESNLSTDSNVSGLNGPFTVKLGAF